MNASQKLQFSMGIALLIGCFIWAYMSSQTNYAMGLYLLTGMGIGYVLSRSRYGFAGIIRKLYKMGNGDLARAVLFLLFITVIVILSFQFIAMKKELTVPAMSSVKPNSLLTVMGGIIFGMGMIFAGGCASGTLTGMGDLYIGSFFAIVFFCLGSVIGVWSLDYLQPTFLNWGPKIYMPEYFGYIGSLVFVGIIYILLSFSIKRYELYRQRKGTYIPESKPTYPYTIQENAPLFSQTTLHKIFNESWSLYTGSVLLAILFISITITTGKNWGITSTFIYWGGWVLEPLGFDIQSIGYYANSASKTKRFVENTIFTDPGSLRNIGLFLGPLVYTLTSCSAKFKMSWKWKNVVAYSVGGLMMGYGARLADGCNIGAFYSALSSMSFSGFIFGFFMLVGAYWALKLVDRSQLDV